MRRRLVVTSAWAWTVCLLSCAASCGEGGGADAGDTDTAEVAVDVADADAATPDGDASEPDAELPDAADADADAAPDELPMADADADADAETDTEVDAGPPPCLSDDDCAGGPCSVGSCDLTDGLCTVVALPDGSACDDHNACSLDDACQAGVCTGTQGAVCDDGNPCTDDVCAPDKGCVFKNNFALCEDGDPCTAPDSCVAGVCQPGEAACSDGNPCTVDACDPVSGACSHMATDSVPCSDGSECTFGDHCEVGVCIPGTLDGCNDGNQCTDDLCVDGTTCTHAPASGTPCGDGEPCTGPDACEDGECVAGPPIDCDDGNDCTDEFCDASIGCVVTPSAPKPCEDQNLCTTKGMCDGGGGCTPTAFLDCDDGKLCTVDTCKPDSGCDHNPIGGPCDDGDACTSGDLCLQEVCVGDPVDCDDGNACTQDSCDPTLGCQSFDISPSCDDGNPCTDDGCDSGLGCVNTPNDAPCPFQADPCVTGAVCSAGACQPVPLDCDDGDPCTLDVCDPEELCVHQRFVGPCDDGDACTEGEVCDAGGECGGGAPVDLDDGVACTVDSCDPLTGVEHIEDYTACPLGSACFADTDCTVVPPQLIISRLSLRPDPAPPGAGQGTWLAITNIGVAAVDLRAFRLDSAVSSLASIFPLSGEPGDPVPIRPGETLAGIKTPPEGQPVPPGFAFTFGLATDAFAFGKFGDQATILTPTLKVHDFLSFQTFSDGPTIIFGAMPLVDGTVAHLDASRLATAQLTTANDDVDDWCLAREGAPSAPDAPQTDCTLVLLSEVALGGEAGQRWIELYAPPGGNLSGLVVRVFDAGGVALASFPLAPSRAPHGERFLISDAEGDSVLPQVTDGAVQLFRGAILLDAYGFGTLTTSTDAAAGFPLFEGTPGPSQAGGAVAVRAPEYEDTQDNAADWTSDPEGSPGQPNADPAP
ncbi:MAG: hypothetical protein H6744_05160 [Deltaproteobacteria bacterium]|nr:hypothetical protein [Deltaproteobacteria bacterium]MCB9786066.1 hypothetical protein [Deltaproteobacteria bacterium]